jgi:hypothetical protein
MADASGFWAVSFLSEAEVFFAFGRSILLRLHIISTPKWRQSTASETPPPTAQPSFNSPFSCFLIILFYDAA